MESDKKTGDLSDKIKIALDKGKKKLIAETKAANSYLLLPDNKGGIRKIHAKDL